MSNKQYSIFGVNTELDLEKTKAKVMQSLKLARVGAVADNAVHFESGATGFIDIFTEQSEIRAEVQADDEESLLQAQAVMQEHLFTVLEIDPEASESEWRNITNNVLSEQARLAAEAARKLAESATE